MIKKIIIAGGGSSGWMTASALAYKCPELDLTLIESKDIPTIGVGESTLGFINEFMNLLDMKDEEWMPHCDATHKNSIQFTDFYKKNTRFQYPFGNMVGTDQFTINDYFRLKSLDKNISPEDFARYFNVSALLAEYNKQTYEPLDGYNFSQDTGYHLDATKFGLYLKDRFCSNITHVVGTIDHISVDDTGITGLHIEDKKLQADMYIDCTGFKSLLIKKVEDKDTFTKFKNLETDKSVIARYTYKDENDREQNITNVTNCTAMNCGWMWDISLWNRRGKGYVYSSKFIDDETAEREFREKTGHEGDVFYVPFNHGARQSAWVKNVLAVGLSCGFIEPLESTGLFTIHENIIKFIQTLKSSENQPNLIDKEIFNKHLKLFIFGLSEFVSIHYGLSKNRHTDFWKHVTQNVSYDIDYDKYYSNWLQFLTQSFGSSNYLPGSAMCNGGTIYIMAGMNTNYTSISDESSFDKDKTKEVANYFYEIINRRTEIIKTFQSSYEFLKEHIYTK